MSLQVNLLGTFEATLDGKPVKGFRSKNVQALFIFLICQADEDFQRDWLATLFWGDRPTSVARKNMRQSIYQLRKILPVKEEATEPYLLVTSDTLQFNTASDYSLDVDQFTNALVAQELDQARETYHGELASGISLDNTQYSNWLNAHREKLAQQYLQLLQAMALRSLANNAFAEAQALAHEQLALEPWNESAHQLLMRVLTFTGARTSAIAQFDRCSEVLADELGIPPSAETFELFEQIRDGQLTHEVPPPRTEPSQPVSLPYHTIPVLGRESELRLLDSLLIQPETQLVTIVAPGGMGKTRLVLEVARHHLDSTHYADGVVFVELAGLEDVGQLSETILDALGVPLDTSNNLIRSSKQQLLDYLKGKQHLLILDNFEHLLSGSEVVSVILQASPLSKIVITSRQLLGLQAEHTFHLKGLNFIQLDQRRDNELAPALRLFRLVGQRSAPGFAISPTNETAIEQICELVDGMPLAIELAASLLSMMEPADIATEIKSSFDILVTEMHDVPERQRSIRAIFQSSWSRLASSEQLLFAQLSVFRGGFTRDAFRAISQSSVRLLANLIAKALIQYDRQEDRYRFHELIRQFGEEKLTTYGDEAMATAGRHAAYFSAFLAKHDSSLRSGNLRLALWEIDKELENLFVAWRYAASIGDYVVLYDAIAPLGRFLELQGRFEDGRELLTIIASSNMNFETDFEARVTASALCWMVLFQNELGMGTEARQSIKKAQSLQLLIQDSQAALESQAEVDLRCGQIMYELDNKLANQAFRNAFVTYQSLDRHWEAFYALNGIGQTFFRQGKHKLARKNLEAAFRMSQKLHDQYGQAITAQILSYFSRYIGEGEAAIAYAAESRTISETLGLPILTAKATYNLGYSIGVFADVEKGLELVQEAAMQLEQLYAISDLLIVYHDLMISAAATGKMDSFHFYTNKGRELATKLPGHQFVASLNMWHAICLVIAGEGEEARLQLRHTVANLIFGATLSEGVTGIAWLVYVERHSHSISTIRYWLLTLFNLAIDNQLFYTVHHTVEILILMVYEQMQSHKNKSDLMALCCELIGMNSHIPAFRTKLRHSKIHEEPLQAIRQQMGHQAFDAIVNGGQSRVSWQVGKELVERLIKFDWPQPGTDYSNILRELRVAGLLLSAEIEA